MTDLDQDLALAGPGPTPTKPVVLRNKNTFIRLWDLFIFVLTYFTSYKPQSIIKVGF